MRFVRLWLLALPLAFVIAACGGDSDTSASKADGGAPAGADGEAVAQPATSGEKQAVEATGEFNATGRMNQGRADHNAVLLADGRVMATGGRGKASGGGFGSAAIKHESAEIWDPATEEWTPTGKMTYSQGRELFTIDLLQDGRVLITGGTGQPQGLSEADRDLGPGHGHLHRRTQDE